MIPLRYHLLVLLSLTLGACATKVSERKRTLYDPKPTHVQTGIASWDRDHRTASGERFNLNAMCGPPHASVWIKGARSRPEKRVTQ